MSQNLHSFDFTDKLNLEEGLTFVLWEQAKLFFDNFALQEELKTNLNVRELTFSFVGEHTILEACKHADIYGPGALSLSKPIITRVRLNE
ncbi:4364_t:CDS:2, partial [Entrophospora sp. SA101]